MSASAMPLSPSAIEDPYGVHHGGNYLTGIQALVRILFDRARVDRSAGRNTGIYVSGYEGSPLAGYDLELFRNSAILQANGVVHEPALNEELAATAIAGTQMAHALGNLHVDGVTGFWYGKSPGLDRASDALRHANLMGADGSGGAVVLVGDDPDAKSSSVPGASEYSLADLSLPTLVPSDPAEVLSFGLHAVELSRASGLWTALKISTMMADSSATVPPWSPWQAPDLSGLPAAQVPYSHRPSARLLGAGLRGLERSFADVRHPIALEYIRQSGVNTVSGGPDDRIGLVAAGSTYLALLQALNALGLDRRGLLKSNIRLLKLGAVYPLEPTVAREFAAGLEAIIVIEDKRPFIEDALAAVLYGQPGAPKIFGRRGPGSPVFASVGELDADSIAGGLWEVLRDTGIHGLTAPQRARESVSLGLAPRTPHFCSGCPHSSSAQVRPGTLVGGGIGCHSMLLLMPGDRWGNITGISQMGGEGAHWIGMSHFVSDRHFVQNLGDGTFAHSGSLAIRAAIAARVNVTFKLMRNSAVAMTGGQQPVGDLPLPQLVALLLAEGVARVVVTTDDVARVRRQLSPTTAVRPREDIIAVQDELALVDGVTVLIHDQECATEKRRRWKRQRGTAPTERMVINERVCDGCGDCGAKSNCLSVQPTDTAFGRKTRINQSTCSVDVSCLQGDCPSFVTVRAVKHPGDVVPEVDVPADPVLPNMSHGFGMRLTGIGGTGITTLSRVIATAAALEGRYVRTLDQTGLAQKGGPVVSDIHLSSQYSARSPKLASGECDLYLGCDALVAAEPANLKATDHHRTVAICSSSRVPTGAMVSSPMVVFPRADAIGAAITGRFRQERFIDSIGLASERLGDEVFANMILLGAAYQAGSVPISAESIEQAIALNGVQVARNRAAFRLGRRAVETSLSEMGESPLPSMDVEGVVRIRVDELSAYHDRSYASSYEKIVARVGERERDAVVSDQLTRAVAIHLHALMAYKDEYEVARLCLDPAFRTLVDEQFGAGATVQYHLHPPLLRAMGLRRKLRFGSWITPGLRLLSRMRRIRGTFWDPFGYSRVRRAERSLIREYVAVLDEVLPALTEENHSLAVDIAELPTMIRGYEGVKLANVDAYRQRMAAHLEQFRTRASSPHPEAPQGVPT